MRTQSRFLSLLLFFVAPTLFGDLPPDQFHGQVLIQTNGPQRLYVLVDSFEQEGRGRDGAVDHLFVLATPGEFTPMSVFFEEAEVTVYNHGVSIHSRRERSAFVLSTYPLDVRFATGTTWTTFRGDAMTHHSGRTPLRIGEVRKNDPAVTSSYCDGCDPLYQDPDPYGGASGRECTAGGSGASSCSIGCGTYSGSTCSATCTTGYACCYCSFGQAYCKCQK